jgi:hypothetical protein
MSDGTLKAFQSLFLSRLDTLAHILDKSADHFQNEGDSILLFSITDDMLPFGTQIVFTCNQPHNFARWCAGQAMANLESDVASIGAARRVIEQTRESLISTTTDDSKLNEIQRVDLAEGQYLELPGAEYVNDFLLPNFYFHLVTAYNIMRMKGVPLGKADYMSHLLSQVKLG